MGKYKYTSTISTKRYQTDPELIAEYAKRLGLPLADAKFLLDEAVDSIRYIVDKNATVNIRRLGIFYLFIRKRSKVYSPRTGEYINVPLKYLVKFQPHKSFKNLVNSKVKKNIKIAFEHGEGRDATNIK